MPAKKLLTINNVTKSIAQWSKEYNINRGTVYDRINKQHMDPLEALTAPLKPQADRNRIDKKAKCRKCQYRSYLGAVNITAVYCEYMYLAGHRRPCKGGNDCTVFVEGEMLMKNKKPPVMTTRRGGRK